MTSLDLRTNRPELDGQHIQARGDDKGNICTVPPYDGIPKHIFLTDTGEGGECNLAEDWSGETATDFYYTVNANCIDVASIVLQLTDETKFLYDGMGGIAQGTITNGVKFYVKRYFGTDSLIEVPLLGDTAIVHNYDWYALSSGISVSQWDQTPQTLSILVDLKLKYGKYLRLDQNESFIMRLQDDYSGLICFSAALGGTLYA